MCNSKITGQYQVWKFYLCLHRPVYQCRVRHLLHIAVFLVQNADISAICQLCINKSSKQEMLSTRDIFRRCLMNEAHTLSQQLLKLFHWGTFSVGVMRYTASSDGNGSLFLFISSTTTQSCIHRLHLYHIFYQPCYIQIDSSLMPIEQKMSSNVLFTSHNKTVFNTTSWVRPTVFRGPRNSTPRCGIYINAAEFRGAAEMAQFALDY